MLRERHGGKLSEGAGGAGLLARYPTNVAVAEGRADAAERLPALAAALAGQPWVAGVVIDGAALRVTATDADVGQTALLPLVAAHNLPIVRLEWARPDLEEIFLSRTGEGAS